MPQAQNFTIKDSANADVVFTCVQPASGSNPAVYYARGKGTASAFQPKIQVSSRGLAQQGREVKLTLQLPKTAVDGNGVERVIGTEFYELKKVGPGLIPALEQADAAAYLSNALDVAQIREAFRDGYAPS